MEQLQADLNTLRGHVRTQIDLLFNHHAHLTGQDTSPAAAEPITKYNECRTQIPLLSQKVVTAGYHSGSVDLATYSQGLAEYLNVMRLEVETSLTVATLDETRVQAVYAAYTNVEACIDYCLTLSQGGIQATVLETSSSSANLGNTLGSSLAGANPTQGQTHHPMIQETVSTPGIEAALSGAAGYNAASALASTTGDTTHQTYNQQQYYTPQAGAVAATPGTTPQLPAHAVPTAGARPTSQPPGANMAGLNAALAASSADANSSLRNSKALSDLIASEVEYVRNITTALTFYYLPLKKFATKNKGKPLTEAEIDQIFAALEIISKFHTQFLQRLETAKRSDKGEALGQIIKEMVPMMRVYSNYLAGVDVSLDLLKKARKNSKDFSKSLDECKASSKNTNDVEFFLNLPGKRLPQYEQLIKNLLDQTPSTHSDYNLLLESSNEIKKVNDHINKNKGNIEVRNKIVEIQTKVGALPNNMTLVAPHRVFVREGAMDMRNSESKNNKEKKSVYVYAFNDLMLICKGSAKKVSQVNLVVSYHESKVEPAAEDKPAFKIVLTKKQQVLTFFPGNEQDKNAWFGEIRNAMDTTKRSRATTIDQAPENPDNLLVTKLQVRLIAGRDLVPSVYDPPDIMVQLVVSETTKRSATKEKCRLNPEWDERHLFIIRNPYEQFLNVEVKDKNHDQIYGVTAIPLADLFEYVERLGWHKLKTLDGAETPCEILLGLTLGPSFS